MPGYQALFTDLGGTSIHSQNCICDALLVAFQTVSKMTPSKEEIMGMPGPPAEAVLTTLTDIGPDDKETMADFIEEYKRQYPIHMERTRFIGGALETVKYIEGLGCPVRLITSERRKNVAHTLGRTGLDRHIRFMVTRDDVTCFRPDPKSTLKEAVAYGAALKGCVYIGESPFNTETGVAVGVFTVAAPPGNWSVDSPVEQSSDCVVKNITELCSIFDESRRRRTT